MKTHIECFLAAASPRVFKASVWRRLQGGCYSSHQEQIIFLLLISETLTFLLLQQFIFERSTCFCLSICRENVCDSCLFDWTFRVFPLQFASRVVKEILTTLRVDTYLELSAHRVYFLFCFRELMKVTECVHRLDIYRWQQHTAHLT